ncbi:hypothetical protein [Leptospira adleri]|uniref:Fibronectin type-III domain-containing protein n=1 Tax=Leptospira adleri TaxID=2023186 RepID=A0A2M9YPJ7_9LEPT|nr:hypothetical protein [Leptospira adleri]PJZ53439.1 hypothetical protein CH380_09620 [Leptospira adleri]PJZ63024.1 hypothetical protein CH376_04980 [Leptospira adleri]
MNLQQGEDKSPLFSRIGALNMRHNTLFFSNLFFVVFCCFGLNPDGPGADSSNLVGLLSSTLSGENEESIRANPPPTGDAPSASDAGFGDKVEIKWEAVNNAQQYKAMRKALIETAFEQLAIVSDIFFPNTNLGAERTYQYVVQALTDKNKNTPLSSFGTIGNIYFSEVNPNTLSDRIFKFDSNGNIYILNYSYVSKLNSKGAHLGVFSLPNFAGLPIVGLNLEWGRGFLYVSAKNFKFQRTVILKIKTDFSASSFRELDHSNAFPSPQIAVSESKIYSDFVFGDRSSASINYPPVDGGAV